MLTKLLIVFLLSTPAENPLSQKIKGDNRLVAPGLGGEGIVLKEEGATVISKKGYPDKVSEFKEKRELFRDVYGIKSRVKIYFNKIYYYKKKKAIVFIDNKYISGIAGLSNSRVTVESVDLKKGVEYFIFGYGNDRLNILLKSSDKKGDKVYLYPELGIAVVDDMNDDIIDMYIVFPVSR